MRYHATRMRYIVLALFTTTLAGCPGNTGDTDNDSTGTSGEANTTTENSSTSTTEATSTVVTTTGGPTSGEATDTTDTTDSSGGLDTTGAPVIDCGQPAPECESTNREWCADLGDLCGKTPLSPPSGGNGTNYCNILDAMCADAVPSCQLCNYVGNTCKQLGGGVKDCDDAVSECLCRALAHDLDA